jgi:uncharacterized membrane protein
MQPSHEVSASVRFALKPRLKAAAFHLIATVVVAALAATLVFLLWYPWPYREISGGRELFLLIVTIDVVVGPLITFFVFNTRKPRGELVRDLAVVVALQLAALTYGLHTVEQARPAVIALEKDRLRVVRAIDLAEADFAGAPNELRSLSWLGPTFVSTRLPSSEEKFDAIARGLAGEDIGMRPGFWRPPADNATEFAKAARPLSTLLAKRASKSFDLLRAVKETGRPEAQIGYLPIFARSTDWSALVDRRDGSIVGYVPIDGF